MSLFQALSAGNVGQPPTEGPPLRPSRTATADAVAATSIDDGAADALSAPKPMRSERTAAPVVNDRISEPYPDSPAERQATDGRGTDGQADRSPGNTPRWADEASAADLAHRTTRTYEVDLADLMACPFGADRSLDATGDGVVVLAGAHRGA